MSSRVLELSRNYAAKVRATKCSGAVTWVLLSILLLSVPAGAQQGSGSDPTGASNEAERPIFPAIPAVSPVEDVKSEGVQWKRLFSQSFRLLLLEHGFRYATEEGTRHPHRPFFHGYIDSVGALHGWADGDPFYVNYVGHPMQGAISGYIWTLNDPRYRDVEFGRHRDYWKSRLRAGAFAWAYSEQMEIGPVSEASIGNIQASWPQEGL